MNEFAKKTLLRALKNIDFEIIDIKIFRKDIYYDTFATKFKIDDLFIYCTCFISVNMAVEDIKSYIAARISDTLYWLKRVKDRLDLNRPFIERQLEYKFYFDYENDSFDKLELFEFSRQVSSEFPIITEFLENFDSINLLEIKSKRHQSL